MTRIDHENRNARVGAGDPADSTPFRKGPSPWAQPKQIRRVRALAAELGVAEPVPAGAKLTKREAGRFIDDCLMRKHRGQA